MNKFISIFSSFYLSSIFYGVGSYLLLIFLYFFFWILVFTLFWSPISSSSLIRVSTRWFYYWICSPLKSCLCLSSNLEFPYVLQYHYPVTDKSKFIIPGNLKFPYKYLFLGLHNQQAIKIKSRIVCGVGFTLLNPGDCYFYHYKIFIHISVSLALWIFKCVGVLVTQNECAMKIITKCNIYYAMCLYGRKLFSSLSSLSLAVSSFLLAMYSFVVSVILVIISFLKLDIGILNTMNIFLMFDKQEVPAWLI